MSKTQSWVSALAMLVVAAGLAVLGALVHNDMLMGFGIGLIPSVGAALGIPRPQDTL